MTTFPPPCPTAARRPVEAAALTDVGRARTENEDAFGVFPGARLYIVADGMGGRSGGTVAAQLAVNELEAFFVGKHKDPRSPWPFPVDKTTSLGANLLRVGIKVANQRIREAAAADPSLHRMGATIAAIAVGETQVITAHVGDVRVYRVRAGALARLTRDHSVLEEMLQARPQMTAEEIAAFAHRNVVTKALGTREEVEPTVANHEIEAGDVYLLACDGLWGSVDEQLVLDVINGTPALDEACRTLIEAANQAGGTDNITALLLRVT